LVEVDRLGVVNEIPVPKDVPPVFAANQFKVPALAVAFKTTVPASHREAGVLEVIVGTVFTVAKTAVLNEVQPVAVAST